MHASHMQTYLLTHSCTLWRALKFNVKTLSNKYIITSPKKLFRHFQNPRFYSNVVNLLWVMAKASGIGGIE